MSNSHFCTSGDLHCSRTVLASFISQLKTIKKPSKQKGHKKPALISATVKECDVSLPSSRGFALSQCSAWTSIKPWCYSAIAILLPQIHKKKKKTKNQGALVGFLNYEDRKGSFTPLLKERVYLIPNCKSQVRFQHPLSVLSFNNCVIYPKCEASPRHQNCGSMLSQPLPSVVSLSNYTSCFAGNR